MTTVKCFEGLLSFREFLDKLRLCGQRQPVLTRQHLIAQITEGVVRNGLTAFGAEDKSDGRFSPGCVQCSRA